MPSVGGPTDRDRGAARPDIVLGDRFGTSCAPAVTDMAEHILQGLGFSVSRNDPYAGAFTTTHYGRPDSGTHALQVELNRGLYMDEAALARSEGFPTLRHKMDRFIAAMAEGGLTLAHAA